MNYSNILYLIIISIIFAHIPAQAMNEQQKPIIEKTPQSKRRSIEFSIEDIQRSRISQKNILSNDKVEMIEKRCRSKNFWITSQETIDHK